MLAAEEASAALSFRNIKRVGVLEVSNVGVADLLAAATLVVSESALASLSERATKTRTTEEAQA